MQIKSETQCHESQKFDYHVVEYAFLIQNNFYKNAPHIKGAGAPQSSVKLFRAKNAPSEKLDFSMPYCSILFTDSEYITLFKMPCILRELEPLKVCIFGQAIEIEKSASQFYKIVSQNQPVFRFVHYNGNKGKYCIKYIHFYNIKVTKYMKFTKLQNFTTLLLFKNKVNTSINF